MTTVIVLGIAAVYVVLVIRYFRGETMKDTYAETQFQYELGL